MLSFVFFFFQAEDGIRDLTVTGVQTCALPISPAVRRQEKPMTAPGRTLALVGGLLAALTIWSCFVVIHVTEYGLFLRFGRVARVVKEPGLFVKRPFPFETVVRLDKRLLTFKPVTAEFLSEDKKNLVIQDRKSTRLNSSHSQISYAVFCLKKKKP